MNGKITILIAVLCVTFFNVSAENDLIFYWRRSDDEKCEPFTTFKMDCNTCVCGANGIPFCTKMYCLHNTDFIEKLALKKKEIQQNLVHNRNEVRVGEED